MLLYLKLMLQLVLAPLKGWEDVELTAPNSRRLFAAGLLPLSVFAGVCASLAALWLTKSGVFTLIMRGITCCLTYLLTYYIAQAVLISLLPRITVDGLIDRDRISILSTLCVGIMAIIGIITNLFPMEHIFQFLPIIVVIIIYRARRFLSVNRAKTGLMIAFGIVAVILPVYILGRILSPLIG